MSKQINAKGLGCVRPVILAKNVLELYDEITIVVDEISVLESHRLLGMHAGCSGVHVTFLIDITGESGDAYWICLRKTMLDQNIASVLRTDGIY